MIANLEKRGQSDAHAQYLLGRVYSLAYAQKLTVVKVEKGSSDPYFGQLDPGFPPAAVAGQAQLRRKYLEKAIRAFQNAVLLDPKNLSAKLGLGWCYEQSGRRKEALNLYRQVFAGRYVLEKAGATSSLIDSMGVEAGSYLIHKLDPMKDAKEIADVTKKVAELRAIPRAVTPVLIPLQRGARFESLVNPNADVRFDLDGTGPRRWGWVTPRAGWLVYRETKPQIRSGLQLMGGVSWWVFWKDGYEAMSSLDDDGDGWLTGLETRGLAVWQDRDGDGVSQPDELLSLEELGIEALSCQGQRHPDGFPFSPGGVRYRDGSTDDSYDWTPVGRP